jgi:hypothetical protein
MARTAKPWQPTVEGLVYSFTPTNLALSSECGKARYKNMNLPVLQELYHGDPLHPLSCTVTGELGFSTWPDLITGQPKQRFEIDFNHIRQRASCGRQSGDSVDKWGMDPSGLWRATSLAHNLADLVEFMCIMPVSKRAHRWISQDSAMGDITLKNFDKKYWPWHLQSKRNFDRIAAKYSLGLDYHWFIDHLSNIEHPKINERVKYRGGPAVLTGR